jgi:hypothetical protein
MTKGHPGLVNSIYQDISHRFINYLKANLGVTLTDDQVLEYLMSPNFLYAISSTRSVPKMTNDESEMALIHSLVTLEAVDVGTLKVETVQRLSASGVVAQIGKQVFFSAPVISAIYFQRLSLTPPIISPALNPPSTIDHFLISTLKLFKQTFLQNSFARGVRNIILERHWQMEFYRAGSSLLPNGFSISPDVGYMFGCKGFIDFYVDGKLKWGIELLREGKQLNQHLERFEPYGRYGDMVKKFQDYAILDFRLDMPTSDEISAMGDKLWYIVYESDYSGATIRTKDKVHKISFT